MKKVLLFIALCVGYVAFSAPVTKDEAAIVCRNFLTQKMASGQIEQTDFLYYKTEYWENTPVYHIFKLANTGFVTISASDHFEPVIGYSFESDYLPNPASTFIMEAYSRWIVECEKENVTYRGVKAKWEAYLSDDFVAEPTRTAVIGPLLTTKPWAGFATRPISTGRPTGCWRCWASSRRNLCSPWRRSMTRTSVTWRRDGGSWSPQTLIGSGRSATAASVCIWM